MVRYLFYTIGDLTYQSPLVPIAEAETYVFIHKMSDVFSSMCPILTDAWTCFNPYPTNVENRVSS